MRLWSGGNNVEGVTETVRVGDVVSWMVTFCGTMAELLLPSVAVQFTAVMPKGNSAGPLLDTATVDQQMSLVVAVPRVTGVPDGDVHSLTISGGTVRLGGVVSTTVTFWTAVAKF
jgi:hypothetical protein